MELRSLLTQRSQVRLRSGCCISHAGDGLETLCARLKEVNGAGQILGGGRCHIAIHNSLVSSYRE